MCISSFEIEKKISNYWEYTCSKRRGKKIRKLLFVNQILAFKILASKEETSIKKKNRGKRFGGNERKGKKFKFFF